MDITDIKRLYLEKGELITKREILLNPIKQIDLKLVEINKKIFALLEKEQQNAAKSREV